MHMIEKNHECECEALQDCKQEIERLRSEQESAQQHIADLQSGIYVNCVYCGHRYGPRDSTPTSIAEVLTKHIEKCPKHPLTAAKAEIKALYIILKEKSASIKLKNTNYQQLAAKHRQLVECLSTATKYL